MKKSVIIIIGIALCLCVIALVSANAQSINQDKMDRDLKVASNVLKSMLQGSNGFFGGSREVDATYLEDYGVIFSMPRNYIYVSAPRRASAISETRDGEDESEVVIAGRAESVARAEARGRGGVTVFGQNGEDDYQEKVMSFLLNYTSLIGQLKASDRIMVKQKSNNDFFTAYTFAGNEIESTRPGSVSLEIKVSDVRDYKSGKLSESAAEDRIKVIKEEDVKLEEDIRLFGNIIQTVYESNVSTSYFMSERPRIERMKDFGAIYNMKFYSSNPMGFGETRVHTMPTLNLRDVPQAERDTKVTEMYPEFLASLKENIVEYGRTLNSLGDNESLIVKAKLTTCEGCGIPESVELTLKANVLKDYSSGKINLSNAVNKVQVKENGKQ